jgi:hypothetical protein
MVPSTFRHLNEAGELVAVQGTERAAAARVGHHDIERAGRAGRCRDGRLDAGLVGDVGNDVRRGAAERRNLAQSTDRVLQACLGPSEDRDRGTVSDQRSGAGPADPGTPAADQRARALEPARRFGGHACAGA